jgi:hypothetical protein
MGRKKQLKEKDLLEAIKGSRGFKSTIAARLHVDWHTVDKAINASEAAQQAIKDEEENTLDFVEGKALSRINEGDGAMIRFYLATKGKKRGYTYEEQLEGDDAEDDEPLSVICDGEEVDPAPIGFTTEVCK